MKKLFTILMLTVFVALGVNAKDSYSHDPAILPEAARTTIKNNFKSAVSIIKIDKDFGRISDYEVILTDGTEISFDRSGNWESVECSVKNTVPKAFVPQKVSDYVKQAQPKTHIVGIEKDRGGYDVELSNGIEMKFNRNGDFQRYD